MQNHMTEDHFNIHNNTASVVKTEEFACEECDYTTSQYAHLEDHIINTHKDDEITMTGEKCKLCEYVASNDAELTDHLMSVHVESS